MLLNEAALDMLQALRDRLGKPLIVRSAYRSPEHNRAVGGAKASKHLEGIAFDIAMANHDPETFEAAAREMGFRRFGFYPRSRFIHIDLGLARSWGERFSKRATAFAAETPAARGAGREPDAEGRRGGRHRHRRRRRRRGGAGGDRGDSRAVLPLVPYFDTLRWLFNAIALAGIAVAVYARLNDRWGGRPQPSGISVPKRGRHLRHKREEPSAVQITTVGLDLAKNVFRVHAINEAGAPVIRRRLRRAQVLAFFAGLPPCLVGLEACSSAH